MNQLCDPTFRVCVDCTQDLVCPAEYHCVLGACELDVCEQGTSRCQFVELFAGTPYVVVQNTSATCAADLGGLVFSSAAGATSTPASFALPAVTLQPGQAVTLVRTATVAGDIVVSSLPTWTTAGYVMLCRGNCSAAAGTGDVLDAVAFGTTPLPFPTPIQMLPGPLAAAGGLAYLRATFNGSTPTFFRNDWTTGAPTRQDPNCPLAQPGSGTVCSPQGLVCQYPPVTCTCVVNFTSNLWSCS